MRDLVVVDRAIPAGSHRGRPLDVPRAGSDDVQTIYDNIPASHKKEALARGRPGALHDQGADITGEHLRRLSPLGWEHIALTGSIAGTSTSLRATFTSSASDRPRSKKRHVAILRDLLRFTASVAYEIPEMVPLRVFPPGRHS